MRPVKIRAVHMRVGRKEGRVQTRAIKTKIRLREATYASPKSLSLICPSGSKRKFYQENNNCQ